MDAVRADLESSGTPAFVAAIVTPGWEVRPSPIVFASIAPCRAQANTLGARVDPGEMVVIVSRRVQGDRQSFTVLSPDALATIYRTQELVDGHKPASRLAA